MPALPSLLGTVLSIALHNWAGLLCSYAMVWSGMCLKSATKKFCFVWFCLIKSLHLSVIEAPSKALYLRIEVSKYIDNCWVMSGKVNWLQFCHLVPSLSPFPDLFPHHCRQSMWALNKWQELLQRQSREQIQICRGQGSRYQEQSCTRRHRRGTRLLTAELLKAGPERRYRNINF